MNQSGELSDATDARDVPPLQKLFSATEHRLDVCVLALLTWVAACDGGIVQEEETLLRGIARSAGSDQILSAVIQIARLGRAEDLELACRFVSNHMDRGQKKLLAELAITMAIQDDKLTVAENHVLQFLADLLGISPKAFAALFERIAHRPFPVAGDPSSPEWWRSREAGEQAQPAADQWDAGRRVNRDANDNAANSAASPADGEMTRGVALSILGVIDGASSDAIHSAFRKLAKLRHPDRYAKLGPAAVAAATETFTRLHKAYTLLSA